MVKIALIIDTWFPYVGGGQINALEISKRIAKGNFAVDIITRNLGRDNLKLSKNLKVYKLGSLAKPFDLISKATFILRSFIFIYRRDYDLVHAHAFLPGITARLLMVFKGIPAVFTVHGTSLKTNLLNPIAKYIEKIILTEIRYSGEITVSRDFLELKNVNKQVDFIPNGVDVKKFDNIPVRKNPNPTLLYVGRLHRQKNLLVLLEALSLIRDDFPNMKTFIVGQGSLKAQLQQRAKELGLHRFIVFIRATSQKDLIRYYKQSWFFILPSIYEGQPLTLLEAWASKLPVIVSKVGDCQYLVKDNFNGYVIENHHNVVEIASIIKKALQSKTARIMGKRGYDFVKKEFQWDKSKDKTLRVYKKLIYG